MSRNNEPKSGFRTWNPFFFIVWERIHNFTKNRLRCVQEYEKMKEKGDENADGQLLEQKI